MKFAAMSALKFEDPEIAELIGKEAQRLEETLDLIAAENHAPPAILETLGSVFNTKTIEGYPGNRFHAGCRYADVVENLAIQRAKEIFQAEHANVQPHSGTSANIAVFLSVLEIGDKVLSMTLTHGGHLSHGHPASLAGKCFQIQNYGVNPDTGQIDYDQLTSLCHAFQPKMIVAGASSYPRLIDYQKIAVLAAEIEAMVLVDMAHIAGLVAAGIIPSPVPWADFVTMTCYKTMMGGRGGIILCRNAFAKQIDKAVFPGCQGTSAVSGIAAKAVILKYAHSEKFIATQKKTIAIAKAMAARLGERGYFVVTGGTDTHQVLLDVSKLGINGSWAETALEDANIIVNRNVIPGDEQQAAAPSGIRIGTAGMAARGMDASQAAMVADLIDRVLNQSKEPGVIESVKAAVIALCRQFPVYSQTV
jgi:glycine hydroxymethyltransferase